MGKIFSHFCFRFPLLVSRFLSSRQGFIERVFDPSLAPLLGCRRPTLRKIFELLETQKKETYQIVETGTLRNGVNNPEGDGVSTYLFDTFVNFRKGCVHSIDYSEDACRSAKRATSKRTRVICNDSLAALKEMDFKIDCLYLDSYGGHDPKNPEAAAEHIMKEFLIAEPHLKPGSVICIDDAPYSDQFCPPWFNPAWMKAGKKQSFGFEPAGKGLSLIPYLESKSAYRKVLHEYQCVFSVV